MVILPAVFEPVTTHFFPEQKVCMVPLLLLLFFLSCSYFAWTRLWISKFGSWDISERRVHRSLLLGWALSTASSSSAVCIYVYAGLAWLLAIGEVKTAVHCEKKQWKGSDVILVCSRSRLRMDVFCCYILIPITLSTGDVTDCVVLTSGDLDLHPDSRIEDIIARSSHRTSQSSDDQLAMQLKFLISILDPASSSSSYQQAHRWKISIPVSSMGSTPLIPDFRSIDLDPHPPRTVWDCEWSTSHASQTNHLPFRFTTNPHHKW